MNSKSEFGVGNLPRLTIPQKETFDRKSTVPKSQPKDKVFIFRAGSRMKRKRLNSSDDSSRIELKSQSKIGDTLYKYFSKPNSAGLT